MAFLVSAVFALAYLLTPNQIFSFDAIANAIACEHGGLIRLFHPNHLFYPSLGAAWFKFENIFTTPEFAVYSLARFNSVLTAAGLGIFTFALSQKMSRLRATIVAAFLGSTYAAWHYAVDGSAIGTTVFFASLVVLYFIRLPERPITNQHAFIGSVLSSCYVFSHGIGALHLIPTTWYMAKRGGSRPALVYAASSVFIVGLSMFGIYSLFSKSLMQTSFLTWALGYAGHPSMPHSFWTQTSVDAFLGLWRGWSHAILLPGPGSGPLIQIIGTVMAIASLAIVVITLIRTIVSTDENRPLILMLAGWGFFITAFLIMWSPGHAGFRLHVLVPWLACAALSFRNQKVFFQSVALGAALVFSLNVSGPIHYDAFIKNNHGYQTLKEIEPHLAPGDILLAGSSNTIANYDSLRPYFFPNISGGTLNGWLMVTSQTNFDGLRAHLNEKLKQGNRVFWTADIFGTDINQILAADHRLDNDALNRLTSAFTSKESFRTHGGLMIYEIRKRH